MSPESKLPHNMSSTHKHEAGSLKTSEAVRQSEKKHIVVVGGGLAALSAGYDLIQAGHQVTIVESASEFGGLASTIQLGEESVERFYHFICRADQDLIQLIKELELESKLHWQQTRTAFYYQGNLHPFGTPFDLLRFTPVPWIQRLRFGLHILYSRYRSQWKWLDQIPAKPWLIENIGEDAYNAIWHPLLQVKFGDFHDKITAAWVWHRIWRVAKSRRRLWERETFGYLEQGSETLIGSLVKRLQASPLAELRCNTNIEKFNIQDGHLASVQTSEDEIACDAVLSTVALPKLDRLLPPMDAPYFARAQKIEYIGVVCMLLSLNQPLTKNFWTNINDPRISFNGIIEQTNLNQRLSRAGLNLVYIPFYVPVSDARYTADDESLFAEYSSMLKLINPAFNNNWVREWHVFRAKHAQAVCITNFADLIPAVRSPLNGLYVTDSAQFYPEDRSISATIRQGRKAARVITNDFNLSFQTSIHSKE
ncbi:MAG: NAD(P)/FAD-dependent oxidoreductase [Chloroflexi bacterium]|nr:NAD(P)/FAD-dependent oxidoreductase [Chloroflexota bacterium]